MSNDISIIQKDNYINKILTMFDEKKLYSIDTRTYLSMLILKENDLSIQIIIKGLVEIISNHKRDTNNINYRLQNYEPLIIFVCELLNLLNKNVNKFAGYEYIINSLVTNKKFLEILTRLPNGIRYLKPITNLILNNLDNYNYLEIMLYATSYGNLTTFNFWKDIFSKKISNLCHIEFFENSIKNSDDRIYKWYLENPEIQIHLTNELVIMNLLNNLYNSNIPIKYLLKRIKMLSNYTNLEKHLNKMIMLSENTKIHYNIIKYYYKVPMTFDQIYQVVNFSLPQHSKQKEIFNMLKTKGEKTLMVICKIFKWNYSILPLCSGYDLIPFNDVNINNQILIDNRNSIFELINKYETDLINKTKKCNCVKNCFENVMKLFGKLRLFHKISFEGPIKQKFLVLLTKFYTPIKFEPNYDYILIINKILSFLRVCAKKFLKGKIIQFKNKYTPLMEEILNFKPVNNVSILKHGSINWQYNNEKFTNLPPRCLLPYEINNYQHFLLREKADGILINTLPLTIQPTCDNILIKNVKAEYIEELDLYLVFDIDLPNTNILERYNYLRNNHPYTKNIQINKISNIDELLKALEEEHIIFKKFMMEYKSNKTRWYPKASFLVENASDEFKQQIILDIIVNENSIFSKFITKNDDYKCDGIILTPLYNVAIRDIKIKPKSLMTIDLLYDGSNWLDKEKNIYNHLILNNNEVIKNKIYRCYKINNLYEPKEIRYDKKHANTFDIINQILTIYNFDWNKKLEIEEVYYHTKKPKFNKQYLKELILQTNILKQQLNKINPENHMNWLDLGCGKGKLINYIKKYNPKKYVGLDLDKKILLNKIHLIDNEEWVHFNPCDLNKNWYDNIEWYSIKNMKFDYVVLNFSIMHLFDSNDFWTQLNEVCKPTTKILFNVVSNNIINNPFNYLDAYMNYNEQNNKINYYFPWSQSHEISENFISMDLIQKTIQKYDFVIDSVFNTGGNNLASKYDWYIINKNI